MAHAFAAERTAAQHCDALIARGPRPEERAAALAAWRRDLAAVLADDLAPLLSGDRLSVSVSEPEALPGAAAFERIGPVAANSLLRCGPSGETVLLSVDLATALALTDRAFGGSGLVASGAAPDALPRSAALLIEDAANLIARALARAAGGTDEQGAVVMRSESAARLKPFAPDTACLMVTLAVANASGGEWRMHLTLEAERFERLLPGGGQAVSSTARTAATGLAAPFSGVPLTLRAVLGEVDLPLARLAALRSGDLIPLAMARQVPLLVGDTTLAQGSIGTADDRLALRLTDISALNPGARA
jgi:flagellar motor switch protein FliM